MKEGFTQSIGMCLGLIYGMSIGIATHNIGFWLPIGICFGLLLGAAMEKRNTKNQTNLKKNLVKASASDFEKIKSAYIDIINRTPSMKEYARWEYGKHPTDEMIQMYIDGGNMYLFMEDGNLAGVIAITFSQGEDYHPVKWQVEANDDEVMVLHILGIIPDFQGKGIGKKMIQSALELGRTKKMKACRFDALSSNLPAQKLYESLGFVFCGKQHWFANNTGWTDFYLYERKM